MTKINTNPGDWKMNQDSEPQSDNHKTNSSNRNVQSLGNIQLLYQFYKDYSSKRYTGVSKFSVVALMLGVFYIISPLDFIPDFSIPFIGFIDDAAIATLVYGKLKKELDKYKIWLSKN